MEQPLWRFSSNLNAILSTEIQMVLKLLSHSKEFSIHPNFDTISYYLLSLSAHISKWVGLIVESTTTHALPISQRREECRSWLVDYTPWGLPLYSSQILTPGHGYLERYRWFLQLIHTKQLTSKSNSIIKSCMLNMSYIDGKHVLFLVLHLVYF